MKFGKQLRGIVECSYPEWQPKFMSYKDLKKRISATDSSAVDSDNTPDDDSNTCSAEAFPSVDYSSPASIRAALNANAPFFDQLRLEVDKVNDFFLEKQEDFVIEHQHLSARVQQLLVPAAASRAEVNRLRQRLIDFHAQLVILENYSTVNYTGFRKILKKHDKKTGLRLRSTCLRNVTATPFFLSDTARRLLLTTERQIADLDQISKFRRTQPKEDLPLLPIVHQVPNPALGVITLSPFNAKPVPQPHHTSPTIPDPHSTVVTPSAPQPVTVHPPSVPSTQVTPPAPPVPQTSIGARTSLLRLYKDALSFASQTAQSDGLAPPQALVDAVDALNPEQLGLTSSFLRSVTSPTEYCMASGTAMAIGFYVLPAGYRLQMYDLSQPSAVVSRLVHGRARLCVLGWDGGGKMAGGKENVEKTGLTEARGAEVVGPWPSVSARAGSTFLEWTSNTTCALFFVMFPTVATVRVKRGSDDEVVGVTKVWC